MATMPTSVEPPKYSMIHFTACQCVLPRLPIHLLTMLTICTTLGLMHDIIYIKQPTALVYRIRDMHVLHLL